MKSLKKHLRSRARRSANKMASKLLRTSNSLQDLSGRAVIRTEDPETAERRALSAKWYEDNGDKTLRINYPLGKDSIVFDVGGYHGDWAQDIYCLYGSTMYIFEPVPQFVDIIKSKFGDNEDIQIFPFGLANKNSKTNIYLAEGGTSVIKESGETIPIKLVKISDFLDKNKIDHMDLLKINIEGGEYDLLEELIDTGFIKHVRDIQVQFHNFFPEAEDRMKAIQTKLSKTHYPTYQYPWVWDNWTLGSKK